jgi:hypothetical protein
MKTIHALQSRRKHIRDFITKLLEAHFDPDTTRPTLGGLAGCLTDEEPDNLPRDEELVIEPSPQLPHPTGILRRNGGNDIWAHLADTEYYLHIPHDLVVRYKFEVSGDYVALVIHSVSRLAGLELSKDFSEVPVDRMIIEPPLVVMLTPDQYNCEDVEIEIP